MVKYIILGRFQPFHMGHEFLVNSALDLAGEGDEVIVAVGSAAKGWEPDNPWTFEERKQMISSWAQDLDAKLDVVGIEDINDPSNWVEHASKIHGEGILVTSDNGTAELYSDSGWKVEMIELSNRDNFEGWRIRKTALMLSTIYDENAVKEVLSASVPVSVVDWLIVNDAIYRLSTLGSGMSVG